MTRVTSQISEPSRIEILGKYFIHGFVFSIAEIFTSAGLTTLAAVVDHFILIIGSIIALGLYCIALAWVNGDLCSWLWDFDIQRYWPKLVIHGVILNAIVGAMYIFSYLVTQYLFLILTFEIYLLTLVFLGIILSTTFGMIGKSVAQKFEERL